MFDVKAEYKSLGVRDKRSFVVFESQLFSWTWVKTLTPPSGHFLRFGLRRATLKVELSLTKRSYDETFDDCLGSDVCCYR